MNNKKAKKIKRIARESTVGYPPELTRKIYQKLKKIYKQGRLTDV